MVNVSWPQDAQAHRLRLPCMQPMEVVHHICVEMDLAPSCLVSTVEYVRTYVQYLSLQPESYSSYNSSSSLPYS
jgi:hypothetical protein